MKGLVYFTVNCWVCASQTSDFATNLMIWLQYNPTISIQIAKQAREYR
jgi:hypothetical protein